MRSTAVSEGLFSVLSPDAEPCSAVQGIIINGCVRDTAVIGGLQLGVKALAPFPLKSSKRDPGLADVPVTFAGVRVSPGDWVYADGDGVLVAPEELKL